MKNMKGSAVEKITPYVGLLVLAIFVLLAISITRTSIFGHAESEQHVYFEIVFLLLLAVGGELLVIYTKQPTVMILMVLGLLISPSVINLAWDLLHGLPLLPSEPPEIIRSEAVLQVFAQLGAIILLFKVGTHNKLENIFALDNLLVALAGVVLPFAVGFLYASSTGGSFAYSMFMAAALTATSVGVTVAILKEFKLLGERFAQIIIGAAVLDDILGLLVLSFVINMTGAEGAATITSLALTGLTAAVFLFGSVLAGNYFVRYLDRRPMDARRFMLILAFVMFYAYFAEYIKLSAIVGAFMAGVILNQSKHHAEIEEKTYGLEMLFMPIFFISLGMLMDINALAMFLVPIMVISVLAILTKVLGCGGAALLAKLRPLEAAAVGFGMAPRGEVALIVASIGLTTGILSNSEYSIIATMALVTTIATPPILQKLIEKIRQGNRI